MCGTPALFWEFGELVTPPMLIQAMGIRTDIKTFAQTSDTHLPKLIFGEVRVRAADRAIEAMV